MQLDNFLVKKWLNKNIKWFHRLDRTKNKLKSLMSNLELKLIRNSNVDRKE